MNTVNYGDGGLGVWINGTQVIGYSNIMYRSTNDIGVNSAFMSSFFGGSSK